MKNSSKVDAHQPLSRRELLIIPSIIVITIVLCVGISESLARYFYASRDGDTCAVRDSVMGIRLKPNCISESKVPEGPWTQNVYNDCGSRSSFQCFPKPINSFRIVIFGNSISQGSFIPYNDTYGSRVAEELTERCSQLVDVQNVARPTYTWEKVNKNLDEALSLKPDALITSLLPNDLEGDPTEQLAVGSGAIFADADAGNTGSAHTGISNSPATTGEKETLSLMQLISKLTSESSRAIYVAKNLYYKDKEGYMNLYLNYGEKANFLRPPFSAFWQTRLAAYDELLGKMAEKAHGQKVPLVLVYIPQQAQAVLLGMKDLPRGVDPRAFSRAVGVLAAKHEINFVDTSEAFGRTSNPTDLYYRVNGHPSGAGHAVIAKAVVAQLLKIDPSPFQSCRSSASAVSRHAELSR
jgi:GDSL-like lipase/acylhydrolase family protein